MATKKQLIANKKNASRSTGPRTLGGKAIVAQNAVKHGLTAVSLVIAGIEREEDLKDFCDGVLADLAPEGRLEVALAERVARLFWRLLRVTSYETGAINVGQQKVEATFKGLNKEPKELLKNRDLAQSRVESAKKSIAFLAFFPTLTDDVKVEGDDAFEVFDALWLPNGPCPRSPNYATVMGLPPVSP